MGGKGAKRTTSDELVLEADVECGVRMGCECHSRLTDNVFGSPVLIANCILDLGDEVCQQGVTQAGSHSLCRGLTCMLTICPSPFCPSTIAVTRTKVSLDTKFRMHLSYLLLCPVCAARSNLSAQEKGRTTKRRERL